MDILVWLVRCVAIALIGLVIGMMLIDYYYYRKREYVKQCYQDAQLFE